MNRYIIKVPLLCYGVYFVHASSEEEAHKRISELIKVGKVERIETSIHEVGTQPDQIKIVGRILCEVEDK